MYWSESPLTENPPISQLQSTLLDMTKAMHRKDGLDLTEMSGIVGEITSLLFLLPD